MYITWSESDLDKLIQFTKASFNRTDRLNLEKCVRNGNVSEFLLVPNSTNTDTLNNHDFKTNEDDLIGQFLDELWSSRNNLSIFLENVIESASDSYRNIVTKGMKEGLNRSNEFDYQIAYLSWKNSLNKFLMKYVINKLSKDSAKKSSEGVFFSLGNEYNNLDGESLNHLIKQGFAVIDSFIGTGSINSFRELELMEYNGLFKRIEKSANSYYDQCHILWLKQPHLDKNEHRSSLKVLDKLSQIPYEITNKCKILLQVLSSVCATYMEANKSSILLHNDGGDNGVKFTCIYTPKSSTDGIVNLYIEDNTHSIKLKNDQLIILRSDAYYEVKMVNEKMFLFIFWLTGPD